MLTVHDLAEQHSAKSEDPLGFMLAFTTALSAARRGADVESEMRELRGPAEVAGYIEGLAAHRARSAKPASPQRRRTDVQGGSA